MDEEPYECASGVSGKIIEMEYIIIISMGIKKRKESTIKSTDGQENRVNPNLIRREGGWPCIFWSGIKIVIMYIVLIIFSTGIVTDLVSIQDPLFVCERTALDKLITGLMDPCVCGYTKWVTCSCKQVR